ncbi:hypothetical protein [Novosphingobium olei]|uniref:Uncharacterized protein n=1 Tax=Novosphingobium olei TaxID=2728851 RepID=A0A7Y0BQP2_9SPHN|nr:hypothetical protein [Novosphingobium olei]NML94739.1 hypothetical protein [Novosphingobium olei]
MAKPFHQRLATALSSDDSRLSDIEALIAEAEAERTRQAGIVAQAASDSVNFSLSIEDRDDAAARGERARREATALGNALDQLRAKRTAKEASEGRLAAVELRERLISERDEIAARLRREWPEIETAIVTLLSAVTENEAAMRAASIFEDNAEAVARGCPGNFARGALHIRQLTKLALPSFTDERELAWPVPVKSKGPHWTEQARQSRIDQLAAARTRAAAAEAPWAEYDLSSGTCDRITEVSCRASRGGGDTVLTMHPVDPSGFYRNPVHRCWLRPADVARARRLGMVVKPVVAEAAEDVA